MGADPQARNSLDPGSANFRRVPRVPDSEVLHAMPADADTAIVAFSAMGGGHDHFHFFKVLRPLPGLSKLLVRDPFESWYNAGLPGVGETVEEIAARLERELAELGATRVVTLGSSMGAYASILFGCLLGAERAIALAPQTLLDPALQPRALPAGIELQAPDLVPYALAAPETKIELVAGWDHLPDVFHAQRLAPTGSVRVLALQGRRHNLTAELHLEDQLMPMIETLIAGETPSTADVNPQLDADVELRIADAVWATQRGDWAKVVERIEKVATRHPEWAGPSFALGRALGSLDEWPAAEPQLRRAAHLQPEWETARQWLSRCELALGRTSDSTGDQSPAAR